MRVMENGKHTARFSRSLAGWPRQWMHPIPTWPTETAKVVGVRTAMSSSVAEKAQTCSRRKHRSGLRDILSSGTDRATLPVKSSEGMSSLPPPAPTEACPVPSEHVEFVRLMRLSPPFGDDDDGSPLEDFPLVLVGKAWWSFPLDEDVRALCLPEDDEGEVRETADAGTFVSAMRTPDGPSTIPSDVAARMKYCIVVPVLLVLLAFRAVSVSLRFCGTNLQWRK
mmetsp:Transcript_20535/g.56967  ORF Transcript_20535/g.56967 Transcript_20535/m.56967 type:complete len:224 (-) Transcript_20535:1081-1752(-)